MGTPKAALTWRGRTLLDIAVAALAPTVKEVVLLGDPPGPAEATPTAGPLRRIPDPPDLKGPLAGILAALRAEPDAVWIVTACDQPWASAVAVEWLLGQRRPDRWAVLPRGADGRIEPMPALYEPRARPVLEAMAERGELAPRALAEERSVATPEIPPEIRRAWISVNTPAEYERLRGPHGGESPR
jgi:molybdopterin-guanine dinucleotide biosynthesis protein A